MTYPGLPFGLMIAVAIGTAIYYYFRNENHGQAYNYNDYRQDWDIPPPRALGNGDTRPRTRKRKNSNTEADYCKDCCSICFDKLKNGKTQRLSCDHIYHSKCISKWLIANRSCPLCRATVE